jgi:hypothetical protein
MVTYKLTAEVTKAIVDYQTAVQLLATDSALRSESMARIAKIEDRTSDD